ncbi:MAG: DUF484 family protein [Natronospirillum sp.]
MKQSMDISQDQVALFLERHPDFFAGREALLATQKLAHPSGQAISLLEKQNDLLRREVASHRERLHHLIATARDNDHLFLRLRVLVLALLDAKDWTGVLSALDAGLIQQFDVDAVRVLATAPWLQTDHPLVRHGDEEVLARTYPKVFQAHKCWCGQLEPKSMAGLLGPEVGAEIGSVALAPLVPPGHDAVGILVLGAQDPKYFRSSMDTLFLNHVADVLSRLMVIWLPTEGRL